MIPLLQVLPTVKPSCSRIYSRPAGHSAERPSTGAALVMMSANSEAIAAAKRIVLASRNDRCAPADDLGSIAAAKRVLGPNHTDPAAWSCDTSEKTIEVCDLT